MHTYSQMVTSVLIIHVSPFVTRFWDCWRGFAFDALSQAFTCDSLFV